MYDGTSIISLLDRVNLFWVISLHLVCRGGGVNLFSIRLSNNSSAVPHSVNPGQTEFIIGLYKRSLLAIDSESRKSCLDLTWCKYVHTYTHTYTILVSNFRSVIGVINDKFLTSDRQLQYTALFSKFTCSNKYTRTKIYYCGKNTLARMRSHCSSFNSYEVVQLWS